MILAAVSMMFSLWAMFNVYLQSFGGAPALQCNKIRHSISDKPLIGHGCSAAIDLSSTLPFFDVESPGGKIVLSFCKTVVHCCTSIVLASEAASVVMPVRAAGCKYVGFWLRAGAERGATLGVCRDCRVGLLLLPCIIYYRIIMRSWQFPNPL